MNPFRDIQASDIEHSVLRAQMAASGYAMVRGLIPRDDLDLLARNITGILSEAGWLDSESDPIERIANASAACAEGDTAYKSIRDRVFSLQSFHELTHHPLLQRLMKLLVGDHLLIHPRPEVRLIFPNFERGTIHAHQDHTAVAGDVDTFTAWIPLNQCPILLGPLRILAGSHRFGLQPTEGETGYIEPGIERGDGWIGGDISLGDVLLFHSLTVHEAIPNQSNRLRISLDFRFQSYDHPVNPAVFVFTGSGARSWETTYANWTSNELKYYWTKLPLRYSPSKSELRELALNSTSPKLRLRYERILERLMSQPVP